MKQQPVVIFRFKLGKGESIGPAALRSLWERASQCSNVSVSRQSMGTDGTAKPIYSLYASQPLGDLPMVERRLLDLLEASRLTAAMMLTPH